jgi:hypothetical protein
VRFEELPSRYVLLRVLHCKRLNKVLFPAFGGPTIDTTNFDGSDVTERC